MTTIRPFVDQGNYVAMHNSVFDVIMPALSGTAWKVLCFVIRETKGRNEEQSDLAYSVIKQGTGIKSDTTVSTVLKTLCDAGYICASADGRWDTRTYRLNLDLTLEVTPKNGVMASTPKNGVLQNLESVHSKKWSGLTPKNGDINKQSKHTNRERGKPAPQAAPAASHPKGQNRREAQVATRLPHQELPDAWRSYCQQHRPDLDPAAVWENFRDYWLAAPGQRGRKQDWDATWRTWVRREDKRSTAHVSGQPEERLPIRMPHVLWMTQIKRARAPDDPVVQVISRCEQQQFMTAAQYQQLRAAGMKDQS